MAFDPTTYYTHAGELFANNAIQTETVYRAVIGRAYYAAFLSARNNAGITTSSGNVHELTSNHFLTSGKAAISNRLNDLRIARNTADYDCIAIVQRREAGVALQKCKSILQELGAI
jgi:uncharacterized protein (UPF0332 family)